MTAADYERARARLRSDIDENRARLDEVADNAARNMLHYRTQDHEAARRIVAKMEAAIRADELLLAAIDRVEESDKQAAQRAADAQRALLQALRDDTLPGPQLVDRVEPLLYRLGSSNPRDGAVLRGKELGSWLRDRHVKLDEIDLEVLRACANTKHTLGRDTKYVCRDLLDEYQKPPQPLPESRPKYSRVAHR